MVNYNVQPFGCRLQTEDLFELQICRYRNFRLEMIIVDFRIFWMQVVDSLHFYENNQCKNCRCRFFLKINLQIVDRKGKFGVIYIQLDPPSATVPKTQTFIIYRVSQKTRPTLFSFISHLSDHLELKVRTFSSSPVNSL